MQLADEADEHQEDIEDESAHVEGEEGHAPSQSKANKKKNKKKKKGKNNDEDAGASAVSSTASSGAKLVGRQQRRQGEKAGGAGQSNEDEVDIALREIESKHGQQAPASVLSPASESGSTGLDRNAFRPLLGVDKRCVLGRWGGGARWEKI